MSDPVFFAESVPPPGEFVLGGTEGRHAATVRRMRPDETLVLSDGQGRWAPATVTGVMGKTVVLKVGGCVIDPSPALSATVIQALPKGEHGDRAVDLATQAGADVIVPWQSSRCVSRWDSPGDKAARGREKWARVARESAKQSRRRRIPAVVPLATGDEVVDIAAAADCALILHESGSVPLASVSLPTSGRVAIVVGPEGGLAETEVRAFAAVGGHSVRLGPEVLRTSSAAAIALGALGVLTGRWA